MDLSMPHQATPFDTEPIQNTGDRATFLAQPPAEFECSFGCVARSFAARLRQNQTGHRGARPQL